MNISPLLTTLIILVASVVLGVGVVLYGTGLSQSLVPQNPTPKVMQAPTQPFTPIETEQAINLTQNPSSITYMKNNGNLVPQPYDSNQQIINKLNILIDEQNRTNYLLSYKLCLDDESNSFADFNITGTSFHNIDNCAINLWKSKMNEQYSLPWVHKQ